MIESTGKMKTFKGIQRKEKPDNCIKLVNIDVKISGNKDNYSLTECFSKYEFCIKRIILLH